MRTAFHLLRKLMRETDGATAIEYALIAGLVSIAAVSAINGISDQLQTTFNTTSSAMAQ